MTSAIVAAFARTRASILCPLDARLRGEGYETDVPQYDPVLNRLKNDFRFKVVRSWIETKPCLFLQIEVGLRAGVSSDCKQNNNEHSSCDIRL